MKKKITKIINRIHSSCFFHQFVIEQIQSTEKYQYSVHGDEIVK